MKHTFTVHDNGEGFYSLDGKRWQRPEDITVKDLLAAGKKYYPEVNDLYSLVKILNATRGLEEGTYSSDYTEVQSFLGPDMPTFVIYQQTGYNERYRRPIIEVRRKFEARTKRGFEEVTI